MSRALEEPATDSLTGNDLTDKEKIERDSQPEDRPLKEGEQTFIDEMQSIRRDKKESLRKKLHEALLKEYEKGIVEVIKIIKRDGFDTLMDERLKTKGYDASTWHLPLTMAALKYNKYMIDCLLGEKVRIDKKCKDENGDNVFHSLVRHAAKTPNEMDKILDIFSYLLPTDSRNEDTPVWLDKNNQGLTVLNLATSKGVTEIVSLIIDKQNEICRREDDDPTKDDMEYHDITHIDYVASKIIQSEYIQNEKGSSNAPTNTNEATSTTTYGGQNADTSNGAKSKFECFRKCWRSSIDDYTDSLIELLFSNSVSNEQVRAFLQIKTVRVIFEERLKLCCFILFICALSHFVVMIVISSYAIAHADLLLDRHQTHNGSDILQFDQNNGYMGFAIFVGIVYFIGTVLSISHKILRPRRRKYWQHNIIYIALLFVFACSAMFHAVNVDTKTYCLIIAVITGWSFMLFFLTPIKYFSFFTEMLQRVFLKNFAPFSIVFTVHLLSFSTAMYMMFKPRSPDVTFPDVLFTMFKLMIGLSEVENIEETHNPWFSYGLYIIFVLVTYIFLLNALIGIMSETCLSLAGDAKLDQWVIQMLSVMLLFDDTLLLFFRHKLWPDKYRKRNKYIIKKELYVILKSEKMATEPVDGESEPSDESEHSDRHSVEETVSKDICEPPIESEKLVHHSADDTVQNKGTEVYSLPKYVLADKHGHPLATIVVHGTSDSDVPFHHNGLNIIDIETHSPGVIILDDSEKNRRLSINIEECKSNVDRFRESNDTFHQIDEIQGNEGKRDFFVEDNTKKIDKEIHNDFLLATYVLTNRSGQPIASLYVHESQSPCVSDCNSFCSVIDVDKHSPGLIILDDPENGRRLNIRIKQQMIGTEQDLMPRKEQLQSKSISNETKVECCEDRYSQSEHDKDISEERHTSTFSDEVGSDTNPTEEENIGNNSETSYILIDKSGNALASVVVHGPKDTGILNDQSVCNVIDIESNSCAVILFDNREQGLRLNVQFEEEKPIHVKQKKKVKSKKKKFEKNEGIADN